MRILSLLSLLLLLGASLCLAGEPRNVSSAEARALLAHKSGVVVLDVRNQDEYQKGHLAGARLIPLAELAKRVKELPKDREIMVYCAVGRRSSQAAAILAKEGFPGIYNMSDGLVGWHTNGFPVEK